MVTVIALLVFGSALVASAGVFVLTLIPAMPRILALLAGDEQHGAAVTPRLVLRDRRSQPVARLVPLLVKHRAAA